MISNHNVQSSKGIWLVTLILIVASSLILSGCGVQATPKTYRVGILSEVDAFATAGDGFIAKMKELGYKEGENIQFDFQKINNDPAKGKDILNKFVADKVDLMFVFPTGATLHAKEVTQGTDIPVIFAVTTIEGTDLVKSVREPGGNITGVRFPGPDLTVKRFEILHQMVPQAKRVLLVQYIGYSASDEALQAMEPVAAAAGVELVVMPVSTVEEIEPGLQELVKDGEVGVDAILIMPDPVTQSPTGWELMSTFAAEHRLPIGGNATAQADSGAIFSYFPDNFETGQLAAPLADKIIKGISVGSIPVVTPEARLRINYAMAQELGLTLDEGLLSQAVEIIR